jgi:soluble lytic murein transglycosylase-like protein
MSSRGLVARSKVLLFVSGLLTCAGLGAVATDQGGPGEAEPQAGSGEAAAISATGSPAPETVELPIPPPPAPTLEAAAPVPAEPAVVSDAGPVIPPAVAAPAPEAPAPAVSPPPAVPAPLPAPVPPLMPADKIVPLERAAMKPILIQAAAESGLPTDLVLAQAWAESAWQVDAVSSADAVGVLQITGPTVDFISHQLLRLDRPLNALNPADNARMGTRYMRHLLGKTDNNLRQALIAYNQGLGALRRNGPYAEAQRYADRVIALRPMFVARPGAG